MILAHPPVSGVEGLISESYRAPLCEVSNVAYEQAPSRWTLGFSASNKGLESVCPTGEMGKRNFGSSGRRLRYNPRSNLWYPAKRGSCWHSGLGPEDTQEEKLSIEII